MRRRNEAPPHDACEKLGILLTKLLQGNQVTLRDCDKQYAMGFRHVLRDWQKSSEEGAGYLGDSGKYDVEVLRWAWKPLKPSSRGVDDDVKELYPRSMDRDIYGPASWRRLILRGKVHVTLRDQEKKLEAVSICKDSPCRDRVLKTPIDSSWNPPQQQQQRAEPDEHTQALALKMTEICTVMASRLAYLVVQGWGLERLADTTHDAGYCSSIHEMISKMNSEKKSGSLHRLQESWQQSEDEHVDGERGVPLPTRIPVCKCWAAPSEYAEDMGTSDKVNSDNSANVRLLVAHIARNFIVHYILHPEDFIVDQKTLCVHLDADKYITGHWYKIDLGPGCDRDRTPTRLHQWVSTEQIASSRPHGYCGRLHSGTLELCRCEAEFFERRWKDLRVHLMDVMAIRALRSGRMRQFSRLALVMWILVLPTTFFHIWVSANSQSIGEILFFSSGLFIALVRVASEFFHPDQDFTDFAHFARKNSDLLSSMSMAAALLTSPYKALIMFWKPLGMFWKLAQVRDNGIQVPIYTYPVKHTVTAADSGVRSETVLTLDGVLPALVYSRGTSRVVNKWGTSAIAFSPEGFLNINHDITSGELKAAGMILCDRLAAVPGTDGLRFGRVTSDNVARYTVQWNVECEKSVAGRRLSDNDVVV